MNSLAFGIWVSNLNFTHFILGMDKQYYSNVIVKVTLVAMCFEISMLLKTASFHRKVHHNTSKLFFIYSIDK